MRWDNCPKRSQSQQVQEDEKGAVPQLPKTSKNLVCHSLPSSLVLSESLRWARTAIWSKWQLMIWPAPPGIRLGHLPFLCGWGVLIFTSLGLPCSFTAHCVIQEGCYRGANHWPGMGLLLVTTFSAYMFAEPAA